MRPPCSPPRARSAGALNGEKLAGLVNNAGIAVAGPVLGLSADEFRRQMEVNFIGPIIATQAFAPLLGSDPALKGPKGRIVMISSVAGKNGNPMTSAYSASKHALEGLSESLRRELMLFGIDVIIIAPGAVKTPIWSKAEEVDISPTRTRRICRRWRRSAPSCWPWARPDCRPRRSPRRCSRH